MSDERTVLARRPPPGGPVCSARFQGRAPCERAPHLTKEPHFSADGLDPVLGGMVQWYDGDRVVEFAVPMEPVPIQRRTPVLIPIPKLKPPFFR